MTNIILVFLGLVLGVMLTIIISCILIEKNDMACRYGDDDDKVDDNYSSDWERW